MHIWTNIQSKTIFLLLLFNYLPAYECNKCNEIDYRVLVLFLKILFDLMYIACLILNRSIKQSDVTSISLNKLKFLKSIAQTLLVSLFETTVILDYSLNIYLSVQIAVQWTRHTYVTQKSAIMSFSLFLLAYQLEELCA